ncbi:MAG: alpha/beta hydrolase family esterase [Frankia sp.]
MPGTERRAGSRGPAPRNRLLVPGIAAAGVLLITIGLVVSLSGGGGNGKNTTGTAESSTLGRADVRPSAATATSAAATVSPTPSPAPADACVTGKRLAAQAPTAVWITVAGVRRGYLLAVPAAVRTASSLPVIVNFHGYHQNAGAQESYTHLSVSGTAAGYIVMTPLGVNGQWNFVRRAAVGPDDVTFITQALDGLASQTCVNKARVFLTGLSDGADMAVALACADPSRFAAVVPVAASVVPASCGASPPSLLEIHGTSDPVVPYTGGGADRPAPFQGTRPQAAKDRTARYASYAGCGGGASWRASEVGTRLLGYAGCASGVDVGLLAVTGGGHTWPGAAPQPSLGATATSFSANQLMLTYFQFHPRAGVTQPTAASPTPSVAPAAGSNLLGGVAGSLAGGSG